MSVSILPPKELEQLEYTHLQRIRYAFLDNFDEILKGLNSRLEILSDWYEQFMSTKQGGNPSDLDKGAERIFHHAFAHSMKHPNSSPIGADLMYETFDAFIHIDIKTISSSNWSDYKGKIVVEANQTSYPINKYNPNLLPRLKAYYYSQTFVGRDGKRYYKPTLTYFIYVLHKHASPEIYSILLISMPNGQLYLHYGRDILHAGKTQNNIRYAFKESPIFRLLSTEEPVFRVEFLVKSKKYSQEELTGIPKTKYKIPVGIEI